MERNKALTEYDKEVVLMRIGRQDQLWEVMRYLRNKRYDKKTACDFVYRYVNQHYNVIEAAYDSCYSY